MGLELMSPQELQQAIESGEPLFVEFYSPECPHCASLEPTIRKVVDSWGEALRIAQVDVLNNRDAAREWDVLSTPTVVLFDGGEEVARLTGVQGYRQYKGEIEKVLGDSER